MAEVQEEWRKLFVAFDRAREDGLDPTAPEVRILCTRYDALIEEFTGGDPGILQSLLVDGVPVPRLFHLGGSRSILPARMVSSVGLVPGGFGAPFGRAIGGLVQVKTVRTNDDERSAMAALDPFAIGAVRRQGHVHLGRRQGGQLFQNLLPYGQGTVAKEDNLCGWIRIMR